MRSSSNQPSARSIRSRDELKRRNPRSGYIKAESDPSLDQVRIEYIGAINMLGALFIYIKQSLSIRIAFK